MPFLKCYKEPRSRILEESTKRNGLKHAIFSVSGEKYKGEWKNNLKHGKGSQLWKNKHMYEGDWLNGQRHGYGVLSKILDDGVTQILLYDGDWQYGKPEGFGRKHSGDEYYEGEFKSGKRHGQGRMWFADGSFYDGTWVDNMKNGLGLFVYPNGNRYEGDWRANQKHGYGEFYHLQTGQLQAGVWNKGTAVCSTMSDIMFRQACLQPTQYPMKKNELESPDLVFEAELRRILHQQAEPEPEMVAEAPLPSPIPALAPWFYVDCCDKVFPKKS
ncbi:MORN repeat-containing protein 3-like [Macrosteles quadrilineatus]|uniref:MORN repeat-containing protein 3-like n=1 Tax=Macrosteles quadrilineatus TaxID=74068 RepID=UPI0023E14B9C|nr:MORN repeat-containing protein 3-like [Macrosteles quadrilineatus]